MPRSGVARESCGMRPLRGGAWRVPWTATMADGSSGYSALVLAGRRGPHDALADEVGVSHRALIPIAGVEMLVRVVETLRAVAAIDSVAVSIDRPDLVERIERLQPLLASGFVTVRDSAESPAASVAAYLADTADEAEPDRALLVTTADHPLLTPAIVDSFWSLACATEADVAVGVVAESVFRERYPDVQRTFVRLGGEAFSGANLFAFRGPRAASAARFWTRAERHRKRPWRLVGTLGLMNLVRFALGRLDLDSTLARASRRIGSRVALVHLPVAECAIDVDRPADLALASRLLGGLPEDGVQERR